MKTEDLQLSIDCFHKWHDSLDQVVTIDAKELHFLDGLLFRRYIESVSFFDVIFKMGQNKFWILYPKLNLEDLDPLVYRLPQVTLILESDQEDAFFSVGYHALFGINPKPQGVTYLRCDPSEFKNLVSQSTCARSSMPSKKHQIAANHLAEILGRNCE